MLLLHRASVVVALTVAEAHQTERIVLVLRPGDELGDFILRPANETSRHLGRSRAISRRLRSSRLISAYLGSSRCTPDLSEHTEHSLVGAAVRRAPQASDARGDASEWVRLRGTFLIRHVAAAVRQTCIRRGSDFPNEATFLIRQVPATTMRCAQSTSTRSARGPHAGS